jgi:hypothetical protein
MSESKSESESFTIPFYGNPPNSACGCIETAITTDVVTKNVHMSSRWKAKIVAYIIREQPASCFVHLMRLKPDRSRSVQKLFSTSSRLQNPIPIKPCIGIDHMSNQRKAEFVNGNFGIQILWGGSWGRAFAFHRRLPQATPASWCLGPIVFCVCMIFSQVAEGSGDYLNRPPASWCLGPIVFLCVKDLFAGGRRF